MVYNEETHGRASVLLAAVHLYKKLYFRGEHLRIIAWSEDGAANADHGAALLYRNRIIVGHAHGDFLKIGIVLEIFLFHYVKNLMEMLELTAYLVHIFGKGAHAHHTTDFHIF